MGRVIYLLAAEIPYVHPEIALKQVLAGSVADPKAGRELPGRHVDSGGGFFRAIQLIAGVENLLRQRRLARTGFPHDQQLRLGQVIDTRVAFLQPVAPDGAESLRHDLGGRRHEFHGMSELPLPRCRLDSRLRCRMSGGISSMGEYRRLRLSRAASFQTPAGICLNSLNERSRYFSCRASPRASGKLERPFTARFIDVSPGASKSQPGIAAGHTSIMTMLLTARSRCESVPVSCEEGIHRG